MDSASFPRQSPRLIGRYVVHDAFARGGMATIHFARLLGQQGFTRTIAVKHLFPHLSADESFVAMFLEEARLLSRVRHPNVVAPLDIIGFDTELFIAMEYVHGQPISFLCNAQRGPIPPRLASAILTQVLLGLHAVHEATSEMGQPLGIVHRDVSPQNILIDLDGIARLVDFGIAKAASRGQTLSTARGLLKGKLGYLAPEQLSGQGVDRRTDVYMAGIVLWELLTGRRLFVADTPSAMFELLAAGGVSPPSAIVPELPAPLNAVVLRALALNKEHRFESARAMATALAQAAPPAATIELGVWAESIAGPELRKRAARIAEIETLDLSPAALAPAALPVTERLQPLLQKTQPIPAPNRAPPAAPAQRAATQVLFPHDVGLSGPRDRAPNPPDARLPDTWIWDTSDAPASDAHPSDAAASSSSVPSAVVRTEATPLPPLPLRGALSRRGKLLLAAFAAMTFALAVFALALYRATPWRAVEVPARAASPVAAPAALTLPEATKVPEPPRDLEAEPHTAPVPAEIVPEAPAPPAPRGPVARRPARVNVASTKPVPQSAVRAVSAASSATPASAASPTSAGRPTPKPDCKVPYRVDAHGIKRFRTECF